MRGLILAGGRGSRLAADGVETPKALVEVAGRPQLVNLIETFAGLGCDSITCMVRDGISVDLPDWRRLYRGVTQCLDEGAAAALAVTPFVDDELPLYVTRDAQGFATGILDTPPPAGVSLLVTGGVYGLSPVARRLASVAVASLHRMRAFVRLLVELKAPVATVEVPRIIDLDHKSDLEAAERWLAANAKS